MPLHMYTKITENNYWEIGGKKKKKKKIVQLKIHIKTMITKLGTCAVEIEHTNNNKKCSFFVVPRNGTGFVGHALHRCN